MEANVWVICAVSWDGHTEEQSTAELNIARHVIGTYNYAFQPKAIRNTLRGA